MILAIKVRYLLFLSLLGMAVGVQAAGQAAPANATVDPVMPKDLNGLMLLAARVNGLASTDMKPWHLKANYQTFDGDGKPKDQGVFEEWWAGPEKYKVSYADPDFHQVDYKNGEKTEILGDSGWPTLQREMVRTYWNDPLPKESEIAKENYAASDRKLGGVSLECLEPKPSSQVRASDPKTAYCFDPVLPMIRLKQSNSYLFLLFNRTERINGHYLSRQIEVENGKLPIVKMEVPSLETLSSAEEAMFAPAPAAVPGPGPMVKAGVIAGNKIGGEDVRYPSQAKQDHVQGLVMLEANITKAGDISDLEVISGPKELQKSAFDAVKTWKYKPYLLNGQPVEVRTQVNVIYQLGG